MWVTKMYWKIYNQTISNSYQTSQKTFKNKSYILTLASMVQH
jgi:hypothetical protein